MCSIYIFNLNLAISSGFQLISVDIYFKYLNFLLKLWCNQVKEYAHEKTCYITT